MTTKIKKVILTEDEINLLVDILTREEERVRNLLSATKHEKLTNVRNIKSLLSSHID